MRKIRFLFISIIIILCFSSTIWSQASSFSDKYTMEVEVFMGLLDGIFTDDVIDEITYFLPEQLTIINFNVGDFSGDGLLDIAISYSDNTCKKNKYNVILLINDYDSFIRAGLFQYEWHYTPFDISFTIKDNTCYITHIESGKWVFSGFTYRNNELVNTIEQYY